MPRFLLSLLLLLLASAAQAAMTIEIIGGAARKIPVAVLPFSMAQPGWLNPADVVTSDLSRSGYFRLLDTRDAGPLDDPRNVPLPAWKGKGADAVVLGQVLPAANGKVEVRFWLLDAVRQTSLLAMAYTTTPAGLRIAAHRVADAVHEKLLGEPGPYSGRIAYILKRGGRYELQVADADSQNAVTVVSSPEPIISPAWSPDGARLAYVSFEDRKPVVYVQSLADGTRKAVARFRGSNSAPAWSPDGKRLAVALSKDETSQIYLIDLASGVAARFTRGGALDTEPVFSPDGQWLYFTSDRGGSPQIYRAALAGGEIKRVTFEGDYNVSPDLSPDGKTLAFVHRRDGRFLVATKDLASGQTQVLTDTTHDESPSFAANGRMILYATLVGGRGVLATVSVDGRVKQRLTQSGDLREPAWGR
ncbi:MAG: Tol-Pal system protein TolB [Betaproteobacteria bacterium]|nr:Tol-Pal system protein TolB [Betaproteobacteria bacterium]